MEVTILPVGLKVGCKKGIIKEATVVICQYEEAWHEQTKSGHRFYRRHHLHVH